MSIIENNVASNFYQDVTDQDATNIAEIPQTAPADSWLARPVPTLNVKLVPDAITALQQTEPTVECPECHAVTTRTSMAFNLYVCPNCDEHLKFNARARLLNLLDEVEMELGQNFITPDPLNFVDSQPYVERLQQAQEKTGESEALIVMQGKLETLSVVTCAFEFDFMGGSMGSVVGDRFVQACDVALANKIPLICFAASGGARMQEGLLSLMQMARTAAAIQTLKQASVPYIVVLTHPVYGGVTASLAMLGDIHLAEPKAKIGFAGARVIEQTVRVTLDSTFQRAEFLQDHGVVDQIVHRHAMKETLHRILSKLLNLKD